MIAQINKYQQALQTDQGYMDTKSREDLILKYAPLVKYIADRMAIRLPPCVSSEELNKWGFNEATISTQNLISMMETADKENNTELKDYLLQLAQTRTESENAEETV